jgi:hypothetical protein
MKSLRLPALPSRVLLLALLAPLAGLVSCSSGNPVAPTGTVLTITASPSRIDLNGSATIIVAGRRPDGNPLPSGTEIRFAASLGTIDTLVQTDASGIARAVLRGDGRNGTATVTASAGDAEATIDVPIGEPPDAAPNVTVSVNPNDIPVGEDSTATVTVVVRNADNTPAGAGLPVTLTTNLGAVDPSQTTTDSSGVARSTLTAGRRAGTATITAFVAAAEPQTATLNIRDSATSIALQLDRSTIVPSGGEVELTAFVTNFEGRGFSGAQVLFITEVGTLESADPTFTDSQGLTRNKVIATQAQIQSYLDRGVGNTFRVFARTVTGAGTTIEDSRLITIE